MYWVRNSSGRHTSVAPCCAASRIRATAFPKFTSGSSLMLIWTRPTLNLVDVPFSTPEVMWRRIVSEGLARRPDDGQPGYVFRFLRSRGRWRVTVEAALRVRGQYGGP